MPRDVYSSRLRPVTAPRARISTSRSGTSSCSWKRSLRLSTPALPALACATWNNKACETASTDSTSVASSPPSVSVLRFRCRRANRRRRCISLSVTPSSSPPITSAAIHHIRRRSSLSTLRYRVSQTECSGDNSSTLSWCCNQRSRAVSHCRRMRSVNSWNGSSNAGSCSPAAGSSSGSGISRLGVNSVASETILAL